MEQAVQIHRSGTGHRARRSSSDRGYALVALLLVISLLALFALAAAENVRQQGQREREKEAIFRGEQVSDAIRLYFMSKGAQGVNSLPTSIDQLTEGISLPGRSKKLQILRSEAATDPLSKSGEWKFISPTSEDVGQFVKNLMIYSGGTPPVPRGPMQRLAALIPQMTNVLDTESSGSAPGGDDNSANSSGPFIGVASRSQRNSVMTYYGIDRHDGWIFTPLFK